MDITEDIDSLYDKLSREANNLSKREMLSLVALQRLINSILED